MCVHAGVVCQCETGSLPQTEPLDLCGVSAEFASLASCVLSGVSEEKRFLHPDL